MSGTDAKRLPPREMPVVVTPFSDRKIRMVARLEAVEGLAARDFRVGGEQHVGVALHDEVVREEDRPKKGGAVRMAARAGFAPGGFGDRLHEGLGILAARVLETTLNVEELFDARLGQSAAAVVGKRGPPVLGVLAVKAKDGAAGKRDVDPTARPPARTS